MPPTLPLVLPPVLSPALGAALDYAGVGFFAATGAIAAADRRQNIITFLFFAALTGVGGGTLRDLLLGLPVFWVSDPGCLIVCAVAAAAIWLLKGRGPEKRLLLWLDAFGLAAYAVVGASKAELAGVAGPVCVVMGVLTACFGGILRDILAEQPSVLLSREIYVTAALGAATAHVLLRALGVGNELAVLGAVVVGVALRGGALLLGWCLPQFEPTPRR